jgi:phosphomevalonate kinase
MAEAHAPGKLVICGEYAVLHGAPAIAAAIDVRARATVTVTTGRARLQVVGSGEWEFGWQTDGAVRWRRAPPAGEGRVLEAVAATLAARDMALPAAEISLDTRAFTTRRADGAMDKLGLGSSAAITVALMRALLAAAGQPLADAPALFALCLDAHRRFQGGGGSGVDVAASVHGGVVALTSAPGGPRPDSLAWPAGLHWLAVFSGHGASTPQMLERFAAFRAGDPARFARHLDGLRVIARAALDAWRKSDVPVLLRSLADYDDALRALDDGARIGIYTPAHDALARAAGDAGAVYKVSGAGGGDFGIAVADSAAVIAALRERWSAEGRVILDGGAGVSGVLLAG